MSQLLDMLRTHYAGLAAGDMDLSTSVFDPEIETVTPNGPLHGIDEFRSFGQLFLDAVSDSKHEIRRTYEVGDTIIVEGVYSGTHNGPLVTPDGTVPPTGRTFEFSYADILQAREGKFVSHRIYWDNVAFLSQLGLMPVRATT